MAAARLVNIPGVGLKCIETFEHGSRVAYASDAELLAIVKSFRNQRILVTDQHVFLL